MKNTIGLLLILSLVSVSVLAHGEQTRLLSLPVLGEASVDETTARLSFLENCEALKKEVASPALEAFVLSSQCLEGSPLERLNSVRISGSLVIHFLRPLWVETSLLSTGFANSEALAKTLHIKQCEAWKTSGVVKQKPQLLLETCGWAQTDGFYEKPQITSTAVRILKIKTRYRTNDYCHCRTRTVETLRGNHHHSWTEYKNFYDLMKLIDEGYDLKQSTFETLEDCQQAMNEMPGCSADETDSK